MQGREAQNESQLQELMIKSQQGNRAAYHELLQGISLRTRPYIKSRINDHDAAEDVLQEVLISLHKALHTYNPDRPMMPWVWAIVRYRIIDHLRTLRRLPQGPGSADYSFESIESKPALDFDGTDEAIRVSLQRLPEKQRRAFEMTKLRGMSVKETAQTLGMSETAVKVTVHRARRALQKLIRSMGYED